MMLLLAREIKKSEFRPDVIVGVSRGGWPPARIMSDLLENPNVANIKVEFYKDIGVRSRKPKITQPVTAEVVGKRVLVVDDVSDTGRSLKVVTNHLQRKGVKALKVCAIYFKPQSIFKPDFFARKTRKWIIFPWERREAVKLISRRLEPHGAQVSSVMKELRGSGLSGRLIVQLLKMGSDA